MDSLVGLFCVQLAAIEFREDAAAAASAYVASEGRLREQGDAKRSGVVAELGQGIALRRHRAASSQLLDLLGAVLQGLVCA